MFGLYATTHLWILRECNFPCKVLFYTTPATSWNSLFMILSGFLWFLCTSQFKTPLFHSVSLRIWPVCAVRVPVPVVFQVFKTSQTVDRSCDNFTAIARVDLLLMWQPFIIYLSMSLSWFHFYILSQFTILCVVFNLNKPRESAGFA